MGFAHHSNYLNYFEMSRIEWLNSIGFSYAGLERQGIVMPVVSAKINFKSPLERNQIPNLIRGYDFYIQLSDVEGMAMSVIESMSLGLIPVVTKVGEISLYCEHGKNSLCYDKEDSVSFITENFLGHLSNLNNLNSMSKNAIQTSKKYLDFKIDFILKIKKAVNSYV